MTEVQHTALALQELSQSAFEVVYNRVFDNRLPTDLWRKQVEAEQQRRETLRATLEL